MSHLRQAFSPLMSILDCGGIMLAVHVNVCTSAHECRNVKNKQYDDEVCLRIKGIKLFEHETI